MQETPFPRLAVARRAGLDTRVLAQVHQVFNAEIAEDAEKRREAKQMNKGIGKGMRVIA